MKKLFVLACALALFAQAACAPNIDNKTTPAPTAEITAAPTEAPTEAPTAAPTEKPSEAPGTPAKPELVFPTPGRLGNLVNGAPVLPEGMEYFVLDGESDLKYVYDRFGKITAVFNAAPDFDFDWSWSNEPGIYGEYGVPYGYCIKLGKMLPNASAIPFADRVFEMRWIEGSEFSDYSGIVLTAIWDEKLENRIDLAPDRLMGLGDQGAVLPVDGKFIVIADRASWEDGAYVYRTEATLIDENGDPMGAFDPEPFGGFEGIAGAFGGKYLLVNAELQKHPMEREDDWSRYNRYDIYALSGECVMSDCWLRRRDDRFRYAGGLGRELFYANCLINSCGEVFDGELNLLYTVPEGTDLSNFEIVPSEYSSIFHENYRCSYTVDQDGVYAGVKDEAGNWVFRIYNPKLASDSQIEITEDDEW